MACACACTRGRLREARNGDEGWRASSVGQWAGRRALVGQMLPSRQCWGKSGVVCSYTRGALNQVGSCLAVRMLYPPRKRWEGGVSREYQLYAVGRLITILHYLLMLGSLALLGCYMRGAVTAPALPYHVPSVALCPKPDPTCVLFRLRYLVDPARPLTCCGELSSPDFAAQRPHVGVPTGPTRTCRTQQSSLGFMVAKGLQWKRELSRQLDARGIGNVANAAVER